MLAAVAATLVGLGALLLRYLPHEYLSRVGLACKTDGGCTSTVPLWANATFSFLLGGVFLGLLLFAGFALCSQLGCSGRSRVEVARSAGRLAGRVPRRLSGRTLLVEDLHPVSYTIGFLRPTVVVSTGLFETLDEDEVAAVLAHEEAHLVARDNLVLLVAQTLAMTFALVPGVRLAQTRLRRAQELAADEFALGRTGDRLVVASSLEKFARTRLAGALPSQAVGFAEGSLTERIEGLLFGEIVRASKRYVATAVLAMIIIFGIFVGSAFATTDVTFEETSACGACHAGGVVSSGSAPTSAHKSCCQGH